MKRMLGWFLTAVLAVAVAGCGADSRNVRPTASSDDNGQSAAQINTQLGIAYLQEGRKDLALQQLNKALQQNPDLPDAHNALGVVYEQLGEIKEAEQHYRRAIELDPKDSSAQNNYGQLLCRAGRYEEAERHFLDAAKNPLYKRAAMAYTNAALCLPGNAPPAKAERYLNAALASNPLYPAALIEMATLKHNQGHNKEALKFLERYKAAAGVSPAMLLLGVKIQRALGDTVGEMHYASLLNSRYPNSPQVTELQKLNSQ
ncbi:MAG: type IV pilus biogenesis/stability protein PilW [Gammaproteobacteria bacterium]